MFNNFTTNLLYKGCGLIPFVLIFVGVLLTGCATHDKPDALTYKLTSFNRAEAGTETLPTLTCTTQSDKGKESFVTALGYCKNIFDYYDHNSKAAAQKRFWLSTTGAIAGGVFGPALAAANRAKSTIAAFSGISGSVNAMQADLNDGSLSEASAIAQRNQVSSQIMDDVKNYISAKDDNERCSRAVELLARCTAVDSTGSAPINSVPASSVASTKTP